MNKEVLIIGIKLYGKCGLVALLKILLPLRRIFPSLLIIPLAYMDFLAWCRRILLTCIKIQASDNAIMSLYMRGEAFYIRNGVAYFTCGIADMSGGVFCMSGWCAYMSGETSYINGGVA
jgi:hypothetical protein